MRYSRHIVLAFLGAIVLASFLARAYGHTDISPTVEDRGHALHDMDTAGIHDRVNDHPCNPMIPNCYPHTNPHPTPTPTATPTPTPTPTPCNPSIPGCMPPTSTPTPAPTPDPTPDPTPEPTKKPTPDPTPTTAPTKTATPKPLDLVGTPTGLDDIVVTRNSITLTWSKVVGASHYDYRHRVSGSGAWVNGEVSVQAGPNDPTHEFRNLLADTKYDLSVRAHGDNKKRRWAWGSWAAHITARTLPTPTPTPPTLDPVSDKTATVGESFTTTLSPASGGTTPYTYSAEGLPAGLSFTASTRTIAGTPTTAGTREVKYKVTDAAKKTDEEKFNITVNPTPTPTPTPPTLDPVSDKTATVGESFTTTLPEASGGTTPYTYTAKGLPAGLSFTASTRVIAGTPTTAGSSEVKYKVTDAAKKTDEEKFNITVNPSPTPEPPTVTPTPTATPSPTPRVNNSPKFSLERYVFVVPENVTAGATVGIVSATDPDPGDKVSYSFLSGNNAGKFNIAASTGKITVAGTLSGKTRYHLKVRARDTGGLTVYADVTVGINPSLNLGIPEWYVLDSEFFILDWIIPSSERLAGYQYHLDVPVDTGFQINSGTSLNSHRCNWSSPPPPNTPWVDPDTSFTIVRCKLGTGTASITLWKRPKSSTSPSSKAMSLGPLQQSLHQSDNQVGYSIRTPFMVGAKPAHVPTDYEPNATTTRDGIAHAVSTWKSAQAYVTFEAVSSSPDTTIKGYWNPGTKDDKCDVSSALACVDPDGSGPEIKHQIIWVKYPPLIYSSYALAQWTNNLTEAQEMPDDYYYLPGVLMHEFGHAAGLGHSLTRGDVMGPNVKGMPREAPTRYDVNGMKHVYEGHTKH